jgi:hypothetical protein
VLIAIGRLAEDPRSADLRRLKGRAESRLRVGDWRVIVELEDAARAIVVQRILPADVPTSADGVRGDDARARAVGRRCNHLQRDGSLGPTSWRWPGECFRHLACGVPGNRIGEFPMARDPATEASAENLDGGAVEPRVHMQSIDLARRIPSAASGDEQVRGCARGRP